MDHPFLDIFLPQLFVQFVQLLMESISIADSLFVSDRPVITLVLDKLAIFETTKDRTDRGFLDTGSVDDFRWRECLVVVPNEKANNLLSVRDLNEIIVGGLSEPLDIGWHGCQHSLRSEYEDEQNVKALLDSLEGEFFVEEPAYLPLEADDGRITFSGIIDLVHVLPDRVEIIDYKTDRGRHAHEEYRTQLSVYYHALDDWFDDREVTASVYYTAADERVMIEPRSKVELLARREVVA